MVVFGHHKKALVFQSESLICQTEAYFCREILLLLQAMSKHSLTSVDRVVVVAK